MTVKLFIYSFIFVFLLLVGGATWFYYQKLETYGNYSLFPKLDNDTIFILTDVARDRAYTCKTSGKLDLRTLKNYGESLTDTNGVYRIYDIDGETLIFDLEADLHSFQTFGNSMYARDKYHIYHARDGILENADIETFEAIYIKDQGRIADGRDKNNYYFWSEIVTDTVGFGKNMNKSR
jgi:hypothetical protein